MARGRPVDADYSAYGPDYALLREIWELQNIKATGWAYCGNSHLAAMPELCNGHGRPAHTDAVSRRLRNLERRGLIERTIARGNSRRVRVTHRGRRALGPRVVRGGIRLRQATRPRTQAPVPGRQVQDSRSQVLQPGPQAREPGLVRTQQPTHSTHSTRTRPAGAPEKAPAPALKQTKPNASNPPERVIDIVGLEQNREANAVGPGATASAGFVQLAAKPDSDAGRLLVTVARKLSPGSTDLIAGSFLREQDGFLIFAEELPERLKILLQQYSDRVRFEPAPGRSALTRRQFWEAAS